MKPYLLELSSASNGGARPSLRAFDRVASIWSLGWPFEGFGAAQMGFSSSYNLGVSISILSMSQTVERALAVFGGSFRFSGDFCCGVYGSGGVKESLVALIF